MEEYYHLANMALAILTPTLYSSLISAAAGAVYGCLGSMFFSLDMLDGAILGLLGLTAAGFLEGIIFSVLVLTAKLSDNNHLKSHLLFDRSLVRNHYIGLKLAGVAIADASLNTFVASWVGILLYQLKFDTSPSIQFYQMLLILTSAYTLMGGIILSKNKYYVARKASVHFFNGSANSENSERTEQSYNNDESDSGEYESLENTMQSDSISQDSYLDTDDLELIRY